MFVNVELTADGDDYSIRRHALTVFISCDRVSANTNLCAKVCLRHMQRLSDFTNSIVHIVTSLCEYNTAIMSRCQYF